MEHLQVRSALIRPRRHLLANVQYHAALPDRFATWRMVAGLPAV
jgi:hypothetical protein